MDDTRRLEVILSLDWQNWQSKLDLLIKNSYKHEAGETLLKLLPTSDVMFVFGRYLKESHYSLFIRIKPRPTVHGQNRGSIEVKPDYIAEQLGWSTKKKKAFLEKVFDSFYTERMANGDWCKLQLLELQDALTMANQLFPAADYRVKKILKEYLKSCLEDEAKKIHIYLPQVYPYLPNFPVKESTLGNEGINVEIVNWCIDQLLELGCSHEEVHGIVLHTLKTELSHTTNPKIFCALVNAKVFPENDKGLFLVIQRGVCNLLYSEEVLESLSQLGLLTTKLKKQFQERTILELIYGKFSLTKQFVETYGSRLGLDPFETLVVKAAERLAELFRNYGRAVWLMRTINKKPPPEWVEIAEVLEQSTEPR